MKAPTLDYSTYLVLYSGGADSTYFIEREPTARHLIHYTGINDLQTKVAVVNANILNRYLTIVPMDTAMHNDGETNLIHSLYDTKLAIDAGIKALQFGMEGIVMCFNADDLAIDFESINRIFQRIEKNFRLLTPLRDIKAKTVRANLKKMKSGLRVISCMTSSECGFCAKCKRGY